MDVTPDTWRWIWLAIAAVLITGEMFVAGTFILIPFGLSAAVAMILAFLGVPLLINWLVFVGLGGALFSSFLVLGILGGFHECHDLYTTGPFPCSVASIPHRPSAANPESRL